MKQYPGVIAFLTFFMLTLFTLIASAQAQTAGPDGIVIVNGKRYIEGEFYLDSAADTMALKQAGMRRFEFRGHSVNSVCYGVLVPEGVNFRTLPAHVSCQMDNPTEQLPTYEEYLRMVPQERESLGRRLMDREYNEGFGYYYNVNPGAERRMPDAQHDGRGRYYNPSSYYYNDGGYYSPYPGYGSSTHGYRGGNIGFDGPPTDRPSRRNTLTYDEHCPVFSIPATGTYLLSPGNPVRPVIGTPQPCR